MNPRKYADELYNFWTRTKEGPSYSLKIASRNVEASDPKHWSNLPIGPVFASKGYGSDKWNLETKTLRKTYNFWVEVSNILRKKLNG